MSTEIGGRRRQAGYTLIEVLAAFAILAVALALLLAILTGSAHQVRQADEAGVAALHARSLLEEVGVGIQLQPGRSSGELEGGRYHWQLEVSPYPDPLVAEVVSADPGTARLMQVVLDVSWSDASDRPGRISLRTLRLVRPEVDASFQGRR